MGLGIGNLRHPGPGFFPFIASMGIIFSCFGILVHTMLLHSEVGESANIQGNWPKVIVLVIILLAFPLFLAKVGYLILCFLSMAIMLRLLEPMRWSNTILSAAMIAYSSSIFFNYLLGLELPRGIIPYGFLKIFY